MGSPGPGDRDMMTTSKANAEAPTNDAEQSKGAWHFLSSHPPRQLTTHPSTVVGCKEM